jgi:hypothetical protein
MIPMMAKKNPKKLGPVKIEYNATNKIIMPKYIKMAPPVIK